MKIVWTIRAQERMKEHSDFIAQDNIENALKWELGITEKVGKLIDFPEQGRVVPEDGRPDIREIFYKSHRIIYKFTPKTIYILTLRHVKRLMDKKEL